MTQTNDTRLRVVENLYIQHISTSLACTTSHDVSRPRRPPFVCDVCSAVSCAANGRQVGGEQRVICGWYSEAGCSFVFIYINFLLQTYKMNCPNNVQQNQSNVLQDNMRGIGVFL